MMSARLCFRLSLLALVVLLPPSGSAQVPSSDLRTMLHDAAYVLNRFDELTEGLDVDIDNWNVSADTKSLSKHGFAAVRENVHTEKPRLNALLTKDNVSTVDIFDVYQELLEVSGELSDQSTNILNWGDDKSRALDFTRLGNRANVLGSELGVVVRSRIQKQEIALRSCTVKAH